MRKYCLKRSLALIPTLFVISVILFALVKMMPGDPVAMMMDPHTKPELYAASYAVKKEELGYNDTLPVQYIRYMEHLLKGEYGYSSSYQRPVSDDEYDNAKRYRFSFIVLAVFDHWCILCG